MCGRSSHRRDSTHGQPSSSVRRISVLYDWLMHWLKELTTILHYKCDILYDCVARILIKTKTDSSSKIMNNLISEYGNVFCCDSEYFCEHVI